ncbi:F0F1 ATP synthase subunit delta [Rhodovulum sp. YNF3179]|uniref:F0F1 ATP synthase subunit delta n=1 Tax=Rhodovulum sp. YNF3179 TaxID=3425127 RepID=UPI003D35048C
MQIDWLTVAAQIVNFLVLVWLLQRFLYGPITRAMARRETRIEDRLADARAMQDEARDEAEALRAERRELDDRREQILADARQRAAGLRQDLEDEIRAEVRDQRADWQRQIADEHDDFLAELRRRAAAQVVEVIRSILADYADADLAGQVAAQFAARLDALDAERRDALAHAAKRTGAQAVVESGATLPAAARSRITRAVHETVEADLDVVYETDPDLLLGVRLTIGEQVAEWSARGYLDRLEKEIADILENRAAAATEAA